MHNLIYIRWRDAMREEAERGGPVNKPELWELEEVGWLVAESEEAVTIAMEMEPGPTTNGTLTTQSGRWRIHIPKINIVERREVEFGKAFPKRTLR